MTKKPQEFDCVLVGGGPVGFVFAASLLKKCPSLKVALIEKKPLKILLGKLESDNRTTTLSAYTCDILDDLGVWHKIKKHTVPIKNISVNDQGRKASNLFFNCKDVGRPFGYTVNNTFLRYIFAKELKNIRNLDIFDNTEIQKCDQNSSDINIYLKEKPPIKTKLLVGADGRHSQARKLFKMDIRKKSYDQSALVGLVSHEKPHRETAFEIFYPNGPLAFLPYQEPNSCRNLSAFVFCETQNNINTINSSGENFLLDLLNRKSLEYLGKITTAFNKQSFNLEIGKTLCVHKERCVLIGDAAQYIHPVAGQGLNLGVRDALELAKHLYKMRTLGFDLGSHTVLSTYQRKRHKDVFPMMGLTHGLIGLFGSKNPAITFSRRLGFLSTNRIPFIKKFFMNKAMGY